MLSMFKDKKGFGVLFPNESTRNSTRLSLNTSSVSNVPVIDKNMSQFTPRTDNATLSHMPDFSIDCAVDHGSDINSCNNSSKISTNLTERCQRCWRNFLVVEMVELNREHECEKKITTCTADSNHNENEAIHLLRNSMGIEESVLSYTCSICDHPICPRCRVYSSQCVNKEQMNVLASSLTPFSIQETTDKYSSNINNNNARETWRCCTCVKFMTLMRLFEDTRYGPELVVRVIDYCDARSARIMRLFFHSAARVLASQRIRRERQQQQQEQHQQQDEEGKGLNSNTDNNLEREGSLIRTRYAAAFLTYWKDSVRKSEVNASLISSSVDSFRHEDEAQREEKEEREQISQRREVDVLINSENNTQETYEERVCSTAVKESDINNMKLRLGNVNQINTLARESIQKQNTTKKDSNMMMLLNSRAPVNSSNNNNDNVSEEQQRCENVKLEESYNTFPINVNAECKITEAENVYLKKYDEEEKQQEDVAETKTENVLEHTSTFDSVTEEKCDIIVTTKNETTQITDNKENAELEFRSESPVLFMSQSTMKLATQHALTNEFVRSSPARLSLLIKKDNKERRNATHEKNMTEMGAYDDKENKYSDVRIINLKNDVNRAHENATYNIPDYYTSNICNNRNSSSSSSNSRSEEEDEDENEEDRSCSPPPRFPPFSEVVNECLKITEVEVKSVNGKSSKQACLLKQQQINKESINSNERNVSNRMHIISGVQIPKSNRKNKSSSYRNSSCANKISKTYISHSSNSSNEDDYSFVSLSPESFDESTLIKQKETNEKEDDVVSYNEQHEKRLSETNYSKHKSKSRNKKAILTTSTRTSTTTTTTTTTNIPSYSSSSPSFSSSPASLQRTSKRLRQNRNNNDHNNKTKTKHHNVNNECTEKPQKMRASAEVKCDSTSITPNKNEESCKVLHQTPPSLTCSTHKTKRSHTSTAATRSTNTSLSQHTIHRKSNSKHSWIARRSNISTSVAKNKSSSSSYLVPVQTCLFNSVTRLTEANNRHHSQHRERYRLHSPQQQQPSEQQQQQQEEYYESSEWEKRDTKRHTLLFSARRRSHKNVVEERQMLTKQKENRLISSARRQSAIDKFQLMSQTESAKAQSKLQATKITKENNISGVNRAYKRTASFDHFTRKPFALATNSNDKSNNVNIDNNNNNNNNKLKRTHSALPFTSTSLYCHPYSEPSHTESNKELAREHERNNKTNVTHLTQGNSYGTSTSPSKSLLKTESTPIAKQTEHSIEPRTCTVTPLQLFSRKASSTTSTPSLSSSSTQRAARRRGNNAITTTLQPKPQNRFAPQLSAHSQHGEAAAASFCNAYSLRQTNNIHCTRHITESLESELSSSLLQNSNNTNTIQKTESATTTKIRNDNAMTGNHNMRSNSNLSNAEVPSSTSTLHKTMCKSNKEFARSHTAMAMPHSSRDLFSHKSTKVSTTSPSTKIDKMSQKEFLWHDKQSKLTSSSKECELSCSVICNAGTNRFYRSRSAITNLTSKDKMVNASDSKNNGDVNIKENHNNNTKAIRGECTNVNNEQNNTDTRLRRIASATTSPAFALHNQKAEAGTSNKTKPITHSILSNSLSEHSDVKTHSHVTPFTRKLENLKRSSCLRHALSSRPAFTRNESTHTPIRANNISARTHDPVTNINASRAHTARDNHNNIELNQHTLPFSHLHTKQGTDKIASCNSTPNNNNSNNKGLQNNVFYRTSSRSLLNRTFDKKEHNTKVEQCTSEIEAKQEIAHKITINNHSKQGKTPVISPLLTVKRKNVTSARGVVTANVNSSNNSSSSSNVPTSNRTGINKKMKGGIHVSKRTLQRSELPTSRSIATTTPSALAVTSVVDNITHMSNTIAHSTTSASLSLSSLEPLSSQRNSASLHSSQNRLSTLNLTGRRSGTRPVLNSAASTPRNLSEANTKTICNNNMTDIRVDIAEEVITSKENDDNIDSNDSNRQL